MSDFNITQDMSITEMQNVLINSRIVNFAGGVYNIPKTLDIYPDTLINLSPNTLLRRTNTVPVFQNKVLTNTKKYDGSGNITIRGGKIECNISTASYGNVIQFMHGKDIFMDKLMILNAKGSHAIEINSSKNVHIDDCIFRGYIPNPNGAYREAIQIDFAYYAAIPNLGSKSSACYDDTHCQDIYIEGCTFEESDNYPAPINAIGTHTQTSSKNKHERIFIKNNTARGRGYYNSYGLFLSLVNMKDVFIEGNIVSNYVRFARVNAFSKSYNKNGSTTTLDSMAAEEGCNNIQFYKNICIDPADEFKTIGVYVKSDHSKLRHKNIMFDHNIFLVKDSVINAEYVIDVKNTDGCLFDTNTIEMNSSTPIRWSNDSTGVIVK